MISKEFMLQTYLYLILSISLLFVATNIGSIFWGSARLAVPETTMSSSEWKTIQRTPEKNKKKKKQEIVALEKHDGLRNILGAFLWLLILLPIFFVHLIVLLRNYRLNPSRGSKK